MGTSMDTDLTFPTLDPSKFPVVVDRDSNKLILINDKNCKRFEQIEDDVAESDEWKKLYEETMGKELLPANVYDWLKENTNEDKDDLLTLSDIATYVHLATYHNIELKFLVEPTHFKWCQVASDQFTYKWFGATPELWYLSN